MTAITNIWLNSHRFTGWCVYCFILPAYLHHLNTRRIGFCSVLAIHLFEAGRTEATIVKGRVAFSYQKPHLYSRLVGPLNESRSPFTNNNKETIFSPFTPNPSIIGVKYTSLYLPRKYSARPVCADHIGRS